MTKTLVNQEQVQTKTDGQSASEHGAIRSGLDFQVATCYERVHEAWALVYRTYRTMGLIEENPYGVHTTVPTAGPHLAVITGRIDDTTVSTVTCIRDTEAGLPLSSAYGPELDSMRREGAKMTEVGLLADRRLDMARTVDSLFVLMHHAYAFAFMDGGTDMVVGVHPRHARFYVRAFGFVVAGSERTYSRVNDHPVVLLRLNHRVQDEVDPLPRGLKFFLDHPLDPDQFCDRYPFDEAAMAGSQIGDYLKDYVVNAATPQS